MYCSACKQHSNMYMYKCIYTRTQMTKEFRPDPSDKRYTFDDVQGITEAKEEVQNPERFQRLGAKLPTGKYIHLHVHVHVVRLTCNFAFNCSYMYMYKCTCSTLISYMCTTLVAQSIHAAADSLKHS